MYKPLGTKGYFLLPPCEVDVQCAHELMTLLDDDGLAKIKNKDVEKVKATVETKEEIEKLDDGEG